MPKRKKRSSVGQKPSSRTRSEQTLKSIDAFLEAVAAKRKKRAALPFVVQRPKPKGLDALLGAPKGRDVRRAGSVVDGRPRQRTINLQRAATTAALAVPPSGRSRRPDLTDAALREAICGDYQRSRKERRETMFAKGSAGKGRRNLGPRVPDWRKEYCK